MQSYIEPNHIVVQFSVPFLHSKQATVKFSVRRFGVEGPVVGLGVLGLWLRGTYWGNIEVILGLYGGNGKERGRFQRTIG